MAEEGGDEAPADAPKKKKKLRPCERCGNFAKRRMILGHRLCAECAGKALHPAAEGEMTAGDLLSSTLTLTGVIAVPAMGIAIVPHVLEAIARVALRSAELDPGDVDVVAGIARVLPGPAVTASTMLLAWRAIQREPLEPGSAITQGLGAWFAMLLTQIVAGLSVGLYWLLLVIPGILRTLDVFVAQPVTLLEGRGPGESMYESVARMKPFRGAIFGALFAMSFTCLFGAGVLLVPVFMAGVESPEAQLWIRVVTAFLLSALAVMGSTLSVVLYTRERLLRKA